MWTLILIISGYRADFPVAIDHVDGFQSQTACIEASRHIAERYRKGHLKMYCVDKRAKF